MFVSCSNSRPLLYVVDGCGSIANVEVSVTEALKETLTFKVSRQDAFQIEIMLERNAHLFRTNGILSVAMKADKAELFS